MNTYKYADMIYLYFIFHLYLYFIFLYLYFPWLPQVIYIRPLLSQQENSGKASGVLEWYFTGWLTFLIWVICDNYKKKYNYRQRV